MYVQKRGDKYRFFERYVVAGVARTVSVTLDRDTPQSRRKAAAMLAEKIPSFHKDITFEKLRHLYIEEQKKSRKAATWARNEATLARLGRHFDKYRINELNAGIIRAELLKISTNGTTLNEYLRRFKALIRWAYQNDYLESTACIDKIKNWDAPSLKEKDRDKYLERDELLKVVDAAGEYTGNVILFLALSGLRIGECIALDKSDVSSTEINVTKTFDTINGLITTPKTADSIRSVSVQPELATVIEKIRTTSEKNIKVSGKRVKYFIVSPQGTRLSYINFTRTLRELTLKTIGRELTPHALRHTHVSLLAEAGVPLETISRRLGHANSTITREIYLHVTQNVLARDREIINNVSIL